MIGSALGRGFDVLVLTNAMRPMRRFEAELLALPREHLTMRVSLDHHSRAVHEAERGAGSWAKALDGVRWLAEHGFRIAIAGRQLPGESQSDARASPFAVTLGSRNFKGSSGRAAGSAKGEPGSGRIGTTLAVIGEG